MPPSDDAPVEPRRGLPAFALAWAAGLLLAVLTVVFSQTEGIPIRDPDNLIPGYIRFPAIVVAAIGLDVLPRALHSAGRPGGGWWTRLRASLRRVLAERWPRSHWVFALNGVVAWYLTYAAFRNVKSMAPFVHERIYDAQLADIDNFLLAGHDPAAVLHAWFGTGWAAHFFSAVYIGWIALVPVTIAVALVWTRATRAGEWYVTAVAVDWALGAVLYVVLPTVGPVYSDPQRFAFLSDTYAGELAASMGADRAAVLADPVGSGTLQTIAAFASLHVGIMVTICLIARLVGLPRWAQVASWVFLALTCLATVYLGWHFVIDVIAGAALGAFAVWIAGIATGNRSGLRARLAGEQVAGGAAEPVGPAGADLSGAAPASTAHREALAPRSAPPGAHPAAD